MLVSVVVLLVVVVVLVQLGVIISIRRTAE